MSLIVRDIIITTQDHRTFCKKCNGKRYVATADRRYMGFKTCDKCWGTGIDRTVKR